MSCLLVGGIVCGVLCTVLGFATHGSLTCEGVFLRFSATFFPWLVSYVLIGKRLGVYRLALARERASLWQVLLAILLAAPLAAVLRGVWLGQAVLPLFVAIMAGVSAAMLVAWRASYVFWIAPR